MVIFQGFKLEPDSDNLEIEEYHDHFHQNFDEFEPTLSNENFELSKETDEVKSGYDLFFSI